jgi:hypothetical protein
MGRIGVYIMYLLIYIFFPMKNRAQRAQEQNRVRASPTGTACLIGKTGQIWHRINAFEPPPAPPRAPKHPRCVYCTLLPPKYTISRPQRTQQRAHPPACHIWHCCHLFTSAPYPLLNTPALLHTPALSSGTLGISNTLPAHPKNPICHPNEPRLPGIHPGLLCFLGGGISPIYIDHVCWA